MFVVEHARLMAKAKMLAAANKRPTPHEPATAVGTEQGSLRFEIPHRKSAAEKWSSATSGVTEAFCAQVASAASIERPAKPSEPIGFVLHAYGHRKGGPAPESRG